jgi:hypothetical protein
MFIIEAVKEKRGGKWKNKKIIKLADMIKNTKDRLQLRPAMSTFFAATKEDFHVDIIDLTANFVSFSGTCV